MRRAFAISWIVAFFSIAGSSNAQLTATVEPANPTSAQTFVVHLRGFSCHGFSANPVSVSHSIIQIGFRVSTPCIFAQNIDVRVPIGPLAAGSYIVIVLASQINLLDFSFPLIIQQASGIEPIPTLSPFGIAVLGVVVGALAAVAGRNRWFRDGGPRSRLLLFTFAAVGTQLTLASMASEAAPSARAPTIVVLFDPSTNSTIAEDLVATAGRRRYDPTLLELNRPGIPGDLIS